MNLAEELNDLYEEIPQWEEPSEAQLLASVNAAEQALAPLRSKLARSRELEQAQTVNLDKARRERQGLSGARIKDVGDVERSDAHVQELEHYLRAQQSTTAEILRAMEPVQVKLRSAQEALQALRAGKHTDLRAAITAAQEQHRKATAEASQARTEAHGAKALVQQAEARFELENSDEAWTEVSNARSRRDRLALRADQLDTRAKACATAVLEAEKALEQATIADAARAASVDAYGEAITADLRELVKLEEQACAVFARLLTAQRHRDDGARRHAKLTGTGFSPLGEDLQPAYLVRRAVHAARVARGEKGPGVDTSPRERGCRGGGERDFGTAAEIIARAAESGV